MRGGRVRLGPGAGPASEGAPARPAPRRQPERAAQAAIVRLLAAVGCAVYVLGTTRRRGDYHGTMQTPGLPDLFVFLPRGLGTLWIEVKAPGGRLRPEQRLFRQRCVEAGQPHVVGGYQAVVDELRRCGLLRDDQVPAYRVTKEA